MPLTKVVVSRAAFFLLRFDFAHAATDLPVPSRFSFVLLQVTNTVSQAEHLKQANGKLEIMDVSPVLAESIRRVGPSSLLPDCCRCIVPP
jgi:hypothetical protein